MYSIKIPEFEEVDENSEELDIEHFEPVIITP